METVALLKKGKLSTSLEFPSLPESAKEADFWEDTYSFCRREKVTDLTANTYASPPFDIPTLKGEQSRSKRAEYLLTLQPELSRMFSSNHKRNIKKARKAGLVLRRSGSIADSVCDHLRLMAHSMERRLARGESVSMDLVGDQHRAFLEAGAGELFQAVQNDEVLCSMMVLRSARYAYYQSAGSSPKGMRLGASHFLVEGVCGELQREGASVFNLGGAPDGSTLARFKRGFGAERIPLESCTCYLGPAWLRKMRSLIRAARVDRTRLRMIVRGRLQRNRVYSLPSDHLMPAVPTFHGFAVPPASR